MGLISTVMGPVFGGGRNAVAETLQVFRENAENGAVRGAAMQNQAMVQMAAEFRPGARGAFDSFMDGVNRLPRPALALGTLGLFVAAMVDPIWFAERMQGVALVPDPLWWLLGVIVSFYFGARHQVKSQNFQREIAQTMTRVPQVVDNIKALQALAADSPAWPIPDRMRALALAAVAPSENPALDAWKQARQAA